MNAEQLFYNYLLMQIMTGYQPGDVNPLNTTTDNNTA